MTSSEPASLSFDFTEFVAQRRHLEIAAGAAIIGEWLTGYEPGPIARALSQRATEPLRPRAARRSKAACANPQRAKAA